MNKRIPKRTNSKAASNASLEWLRCDTLRIDPAYQRPLNKLQVRVIRDDFDPDSLGTLIVSRREDGKLVLLDGQQRQAALQQMGWGDQLVPCTVLEGLDQSEEAAIFTRLNVDRTRPTPVVIFKARVVAGDTEALAVNYILTACGLRVQDGPATMTISAISSVENIYRVGGAALLNFTLKVAIEAWEGEPGSMSGGILQGLALWRKTFGAASRSHLVKKLSRQRPKELESKARQLRALEGGNMASIMARIITGAFNWRTEEDSKLDAGKVPAKFRKSGFGTIGTEIKKDSKKKGTGGPDRSRRQVKR